MKLSDFKALTFDVYGTLLDWETGMVTGLKPLTDRVSRHLTRDDILEAHAYYESTTQRYTPAKKYHELLPVVYRRIAEEWGVEVTWEECEAYGKSARHWPAFDDTIEALTYLKKHFKLVVLTNTDNLTFSGANTRLGVHFDGVYTAEMWAATSPSTAISTTCSKCWRVRASKRVTSCTPPRACSTTMRPPTNTG
jgi:2-haloacid dehalogenase